MLQCVSGTHIIMFFQSFVHIFMHDTHERDLNISKFALAVVLCVVSISQTFVCDNTNNDINHILMALLYGHAKRKIPYYYQKTYK